MKYFVLFLFAPLVVLAAPTDPIDLGDLTVKGEIRRPTTRFYQLKSMHPSQLEEFSQLSFEELEARLLKPAVEDKDVK